ncbi:MAG: Ig-like domain-containing protein, partial [Bacteriovoracaceae bacterium]
SGGVIATDSKTVTISGSNSDNIDPVISITAPLNNATVTGDVSIMVSASDNIGIEKVEFYINNVNEGIDYYSPYMYQWDATGKSNGIYYLKAIAYDAAGNTASAIISVIVTNQYVFTFTNQVHTPVDVTVNGSTKTMAAGSSVSFTFTTNPGSFTYAAQTSGKTNTGQIIGEVLYWGGEITTSNYSSVRLYYSSNYFFLRINNTAGSTSFNGPLVVNAGLQAEKTENIALPTGSTYNIGYFPAFSNTTIQLYSNPGAWYVYWTQGINFTFPGTDDQQITLSNTSLQMMKANGGTQSAADASMKYLMPRESIHSPIISQEAEAPKEHEVPVQYELRHKARHNYHP